MTSGLVIAAFAFVSIGFSQSLPSYQLIQEVDASGMDSVAGLGTDSQGNVYIAGSTSSPHFPVKNAVQPAIASAGLYRIGGTAYTALGLSSCNALALDPQNPSIIYAVSKGALLKSVNSGVAFAPTTLPGSNVFSIAIEPGNDQTLFAATIDQGVLKSSDGGATWTAVNNGLPVQNGGQITVQNLWIDPSNVSVIFAETPNGLSRSADGAASWQPTTITDDIQSLAFDLNNVGVLYVSTYHVGVLRSADYGQTFAPLTVPTGIAGVFPDPIQSGRLIGVGNGTGLYQSTDGGVTWTQESTTALLPNYLVADPVTGVYYVAAFTDRTILRVSLNLQTVTPVGPPATGNVTALAVVNGQLYAANGGSTDVFVTKLDPSGNILYSTYLGGSSNDQAVAMTVDAQGNVFVTGTTGSADFPVSNGAYATFGLRVSRPAEPGRFARLLNLLHRYGSRGGCDRWKRVRVAARKFGKCIRRISCDARSAGDDILLLPPRRRDRHRSAHHPGGSHSDPIRSVRLEPHLLHIRCRFEHDVHTRTRTPGRRTRGSSGRFSLCGRVRRILPHRSHRIHTAFVDDRCASDPPGNGTGSGWQPLRRGYAGEFPGHAGGI